MLKHGKCSNILKYRRFSVHAGVLGLFENLLIKILTFNHYFNFYQHLLLLRCFSIDFTILKNVEFNKKFKEELSVADVFDGVVNQLFYLGILFNHTLNLVERVDNCRVVPSAELLAYVYH